MLAPIDSSKLGRCPSCHAQGVIGYPCAERVCTMRGYCFVPHDPAREDADHVEDDPLIGQRCGEFLLVRLIGTGGFGRVYRALQLPIGRPAAVKILPLEGAHAGTAGLRLSRFEAEIKALARLSHPNIVRLFHYGLHRGVPYLAMELVEGQRLDRWAAGRGAREVLALVARVAEAVQHAHARGIVHRDLKAGNVLVRPDGSPAVLDFGVARVVSGGQDAGRALTLTGQMVGTLATMSPEQVRADPAEIDARADVYALGAIAYELLAGAPAVDVAGLPLHEASRRILEERPRPLGERVRSLRGDVETIVHKALAKDKERRYASAAELAADLERHLAGEPALARAPTALEQLLHLARRHRAWAAGAAAVFAVLLVGSVASAALFVRAEGRRVEAVDAGREAQRRSAEAVAARDAERVQRERAESAERRAAVDARRAQREAVVASEVSSFLEELFRVPDPVRSRGEVVTARALLDRGAERIDELSGQPEVQTRLMHIMGRVYLGLGLYDESEELLVPAVEELRALGAGHETALAAALFALGEVRHYRGLSDQTEPLYREALALRREHLEAPHQDLATSLDVLGRLMIDLRRLDEARELLDEALAMRHELFGEEHLQITESLQSLASLHFTAGHLAQAEDAYRRALEMRRRVAGPEHARVPELIHGLALAVREAGREEESLELLLQAEELARRVFGPEHVYLAHVHAALGRAFEDRGDLDRAEESYRTAYELAEGEPKLRALVLPDLAFLARARGDLEQAEELFGRVLEGHREREGDHHDLTADALQNLGLVLRERGRADEAAALLEESIAIRRALHPEGHYLLARGLHYLGLAQRDLDDPVSAESTLLESHALFERTLGLRHASTLGAARSLAELYAEEGRTDEAERWRALAGP